MISAPRRGVASPNPSGELALYSVAKYSFEEGANAHSWEVIDLKSGNVTDSGLNASEASEVIWLPGTDTGIIYINSTNEEIPGGVTLWIGDINNVNERYAPN